MLFTALNNMNFLSFAHIWLSLAFEQQ